MLKLRISLLDFFTKNLPIFLLALNYILYNALGNDNFKDAIRIVAIVLLIIGWVARKKEAISRTELFFTFMVLLEFLINGVLALNLIVAFIIAIIYREDSFEITIKRFWRVGILLVIFMLITIVLGVSNNISYISTMGRYRTTLGFENPNVASLFYSSVIYIFILSKNNIKIKDIILSLLATGIIYFYTNSRTSFYAMLVFIILLILMKFSFKKAVAKVCMYAIDILFILNLASVFFLNRLYGFDALLSFRISGMGNVIRNAGTRGFLFGGTTLSVDSFYYMFLFEYGVIIYILFAFMVHKYMRNLFIGENYHEMAFMMAFFTLGIMESSIIRPEILSVPLVWILIFSNKKRDEESLHNAMVSS